MRCNGSNWAVYSPGSWDGFRNDLWALWAGVIMRLEHHLVGGYVRYISPHIIILLLPPLSSYCLFSLECLLWGPYKGSKTMSVCTNQMLYSEVNSLLTDEEVLMLVVVRHDTLFLGNYLGHLFTDNKEGLYSHIRIFVYLRGRGWNHVIGGK